MFHVILVHPEIPPNTGNIIRLCANTGAQLHLVEPLGFPMDHAKMRRAGLDYHEFARVRVHPGWEACVAAVAPRRVFALTTRASRWPSEERFQAGDAFVFGAESSGLPDALLDGFAPQQRLKIPMRPGNRSLNLSNAVAVVVYEAWRQNGFEGATAG